MDIEIKARHLELTPNLKMQIKRKLQFSLNRYERHIGGISIALADINGPKGGVDKQCTIQVFLAKMEDIVIKDTQANLSLAIDRAMQRAGRSVARKIDQRHKQQNQREKAPVDNDIDVDVDLDVYSNQSNFSE